MRPGKLRNRVVLEDAARVSDGGGGAITSWLARASLWASIEPVSGREQTRYEGIEATLTHKVTLRFRDDVRPDMRLRLGARIFKIRAVRNASEQNRWLICLCEEVL